MNVNDLLKGDLGKQVIESLSRQTGVSSASTASVIKEAAPALLGMLQNNAKTEKGGAALLGALNKHDGSLLDNIMGALNPDTAKDGSGILSHILGDKLGAFESGISKKTGVSTANVTQILKFLAPIVMGYLGKQTKGKVKNSSDLGGIIGSLVGNSGAVESILGSLMGQDTKSKKGSKKSGSSSGLGGLLGALGSLLSKK